MKSTAVLIVLLNAASFFAQQRNIKVNVYPKITNENFVLSLNSQSEDLNNSRVLVIDTSKKIVKTEQFPKPAPRRDMKQYTEINFNITDLAPGTYTYVIYMRKEEVIKGTFSRNSPH